MTEPTYTIKPLVWRQVEHMWFGEPDGVDSTPLHVYVSKRSGWNYEIRADNSGDWFALKHGWDFDTLEAAKLAAESAYRRLLAEHLVEVK